MWHPFLEMSLESKSHLSNPIQTKKMKKLTGLLFIFDGNFFLFLGLYV